MQLTRHSTPLDQSLSLFDNFLQTALRPTGSAAAAFSIPNAHSAQTSAVEKVTRETVALMRVNHVGEVCAQALYQGHALGSKNTALQQFFLQAAEEEKVHLEWTENRIGELGGRTSLLTPLWYLGAFGIGLLSTRFGEAHSLGFMAETERQVEAHLQDHLRRIPEADLESRRVVSQMRADEAAHAEQALAHGATAMPPLIKRLMRSSAKVMTTIAHYV
ncbi:2-polyprenyl-3-methyl-6-methoxy-1,4-benzoquinone monooxygenase [Parvibium lacunae]|uniref:3-demethoxyubiquinol 3-hydroxylase n=1 Tax=Parvibium lacunae TaxID=1888893 RepID=A0A368L4N7_9BURK|nr:2-polyprenyl-3-methyl-6-methoxy-1,4-benzoquinone monooxygenase [Parvibium lacunae]RCS58551.1 demethoxyubiquinone hydroxylase family protein [Parvibium lacunae]